MLSAICGHLISAPKDDGLGGSAGAGAAPPSADPGSQPATRSAATSCSNAASLSPSAACSSAKRCNGARALPQCGQTDAPGRISSRQNTHRRSPLGAASIGLDEEPSAFTALLAALTNEPTGRGPIWSSGIPAGPDRPAS